MKIFKSMCIYFFSVVLSLSITSCNKSAPVMIKSQKQVPAAKDVSFPEVCGYKDKNDNEMCFWVCTKKEINVWHNKNYVTIEYKKAGKNFPSPQVLYYLLPKDCNIETIQKKGTFGKEYYSARANELKKLKNNSSSDGIEKQSEQK